MHDEVKCSGQVLVEFLNESNETIERQVLTNMVVKSGRDYLAQLLNIFATDASRPADMSYMAMGVGTNATSDAHVQLDNEVARRKLTGRFRDGNTVSFTGEFAAGVGTGEVGEFGIFNASAGGTMFARVAANPTQTKAAITTIRVTWVITLS